MEEKYGWKRVLEKVYFCDSFLLLEDQEIFEGFISFFVDMLFF